MVLHFAMGVTFSSVYITISYHNSTFAFYIITQTIYSTLLKCQACNGVLLSQVLNVGVINCTAVITGKIDVNNFSKSTLNLPFNLASPPYFHRPSHWLLSVRFSTICSRFGWMRKSIRGTRHELFQPGT